MIEASAPVKARAVRRSTLAVPAVIMGAGDHAARRFLEFSDTGACDGPHPRAA